MLLCIELVILFLACSTVHKSSLWPIHRRSLKLERGTIHGFKILQRFCQNITKIPNIQTQEFLTKGNLAKHIQIHSEEKPFKCRICAAVNINASFISNASLLRHFRVHPGENPYKCDLCPFSFARLGALEIHMRTHNRGFFEKLHCCKLCSRKFLTLEDFQSHMDDKGMGLYIIIVPWSIYIFCRRQRAR